jgi:hypothetical protein
MLGNGGYSSAMSYSAMLEQLKRGYATVATDTGHNGDDPDFVAGRPEAIVDWAREPSTGGITPWTRQNGGSRRSRRRRLACKPQMVGTRRRRSSSKRQNVMFDLRDVIASRVLNFVQSEQVDFGVMGGALKVPVVDGCRFPGFV